MSAGLRFDTRADWGAREPRNRRYVTGTAGLAVHWPGSSTRYAQLGHGEHRAIVRTWQQQHMSRPASQGGPSNDIEYGAVICPCLIVLECRTEPSAGRWLTRVGSNGTTASNTTHGSFQLMLGTGERLTAGMIETAAAYTALLRGHGHGDELAPHSRFTQTACPGRQITDALPVIDARARQLTGEGDDMPLTESDLDKIAERVWAHDLEGAPARWWIKSTQRIARRWLGPGGNPPAGPTRQARIWDGVRELVGREPPAAPAEPFGGPDDPEQQ